MSQTTTTDVELLALLISIEAETERRGAWRYSDRKLRLQIGARAIKEALGIQQRCVLDMFIDQSPEASVVSAHLKLVYSNDKPGGES